ncbi:MAG: hypothetical protein LAP38_18000 [Acidobacteriia bacterium]|nr:hypothetical protein [Terriglobia bacterium]
MDQAVLVKSDRDIGARVIEAVSGAHIPVTLVDWMYVPQLEEWQLIIATPWFDTKGPLTAYRALVDALKKAEIYEDVPTRRVFLRSPTDPLVKALQREVRQHDEGFLHILKHATRHPAEYSVVFAPVAGVGGAVPWRRFSSLDELKTFLSDDLGLGPSAIDEALHDLQRSDASSIYPMTLTTRQMKRLGFQ